MTDAPRPSYQRSARNYLLDKPFQLKYTGMLIAIAVVMSLVLGLLLWFSSRLVVEQSEKTVQLGNETVDQSRAAVKQGKDTVEQSRQTVERGKLVVKEAQKVSDVVSMQIDTCYGENPVLKDTFKKGVAEDEAKRKAEQDALEAEAEALEAKAKNYEDRAAELEGRTADLKKQKEEIGRGQRNMFIGLISALTLLVLGIGVAGIIFTHKIAGPIFKMKRLMRQVGEGKLVVKEKLRKGDELHHFFETFERMVENMRTNQRAEIKRLEEVYATMASDETDVRASAKKDLELLLTDMRDHIDEPMPKAAKAKSAKPKKA
jgi:nitrogen fixation/metabolism regulation signal transduction histidine kinase